VRAPVTAAPRGIRPLALVVGVALSTIGGALLLARYDLRAVPAPAAAWAFVQSLAGVWAGVLGAGSPLLHGLAAGIPGFVLAAWLGHSLPLQFDALAYFLAPAAAVIAAAALRYSAEQRA
jgi:hypothetical protein